MANPEHLAILSDGVEAWNKWRLEKPDFVPDLSWAQLSGARLGEANLSEADLHWAKLAEANLEGVDLTKAKGSFANLAGASLKGAKFLGADLRKANLSKADLTKADFRLAELYAADLSGADLTEANLNGADLSKKDLTGTSLRGARLSEVNLREANLNGVNLSGADLSGAILVDTDLEGATLTGCRVYGISAWNVKLTGAIESNLLITRTDESPIQVDNLEVAQFIYLLLNNTKIRRVIDTIASKMVLILGRFTSERKAILDAIRDDLRKRNYLPVLFDFEKPASRDLTETVSTLAHMAFFVIADITDARSVPQELERIVPGLPTVPVQPLLLASQHEYAMFEHFRFYPWVLEPVLYDDQESLLVQMEAKVIAPAEAKARQQRQPG